MREQSNASHASFGNMKIDPHKLDMLDARISGEGGVESSTGFEPSRFSSEYTPPRSAMSFNDDSKSQPLVSFENDGEVSQSSCQTVHAGNLRPKNKSSTDGTPQPGKEQLDGNGITPPSKKKKTPSKRPASAIGDRHHTKKQPTSTESDIQRKKIRTKTKPVEQAKKSEAVSASATMNESTTANAPSQKQQLHQQSEAASKSESRDMHFYFGANSNPSSRSQPSQLSSPPALQSKKEHKSANQKSLHSFFGITTNKNNDGEKKGKDSGAPAGAKIAGPMKEKQASDDGSSSTQSQPRKAPQDATSPSRTTKKQSSGSKDDSSSEAANLQLEHKRLRGKIEELQKQLEDANARNNSIRNNQTMISTNLQRQLKSMKQELESVRRETNVKAAKAMNVIETLVREESIRAAKELRQQLASDGARLGRLVSSRVGLRSHDHWEDGHDPLVVKQRKAELKQKREALERRREELSKTSLEPEARASQHTNQSTDTVLESDASNSQADLSMMNEFDRFEANETIKMHLDEVRREEAKLNEQERALQIEKQAHVRALKRVASEDSSKFRLKYKVSWAYSITFAY
jgi:hypothetical protein